MPDFTSPDGIVYPLPSDPIAPLNAVFQDLAESTQTALEDLRVETDELIDEKLLLVETDERTANYTLQLSDVNKVVPMNGTDLVLTVPLDSSVEFPIGSVVNVYNMDSTELTIEGDSGVTVRNEGNIEQYVEVSLRKRATDEWVLAGNTLA
jgi:hypothetical protein